MGTFEIFPCQHIDFFNVEKIMLEHTVAQVKIEHEYIDPDLLTTLNGMIPLGNVCCRPERRKSITEYI